MLGRLWFTFARFCLHWWQKLSAHILDIIMQLTLVPNRQKLIIKKIFSNIKWHKSGWGLKRFQNEPETKAVISENVIRNLSLHRNKMHLRTKLKVTSHRKQGYFVIKIMQYTAPHELLWYLDVCMRIKCQDPAGNTSMT